MEWIKTLFPLIGVALGWLLSERGKIFADKRNDKRKLKKLLFFLLELRFHFAKELAIELDLDKYINLLKEKMEVKLNIDKNDPDFDIDTEALKPFLEQIISKSKTENNKYEFLSENIDKIIIELAEIFPILAYELSGRHNIKERLNNLDNYLQEANPVLGEIPIDFNKIINPRLTKELLEDLDYSIEKIAKEIDSKTLNSAKDKINNMIFHDEDIEIEVIIDEFLEEIIKNIEEEESKENNL